MDWLAERRRMFGSSKAIVKTFEEFISKSSIESHHVYSNVTVPVNTNDCTKYIISMRISSAGFGFDDTISIDRITNGAIINLFDYKSERNHRLDITPKVVDTSSIVYDSECNSIVIDPLDLNIFSCDDILRTAIVIDYETKNAAPDGTICLQNIYSQGAKYAIVGWNKPGAKIVMVTSNVSFITLAEHGNTDKLLTAVHRDLSNNGYWYVYCYNSEYVGSANDTYAEVIYALSFNE